MALRTYTDQSGVTWEVWCVTPDAYPTGMGLLPERVQHGWLCFESASEKRRLVPVPHAWEERTDAELDILRRAAAPVAPTGALGTTPAGK